MPFRKTDGGPIVSWRIQGFWVVYFLMSCMTLGWIHPSIAAQWTVSPKFSINHEHTDNLHSAATDTRSDSITVISPGLETRLVNPDGELTLMYSAGYSVYDRYTQFNTLRHNAKTLGTYQLARDTVLEFSDTFEYTEEGDPIDESADGTAEGEEMGRSEMADDRIGRLDTIVRKQREPYYTNTAAIQLTHRFGPMDTLSMRYSHQINENEDETIADEEIHTPDFEMTFWPVPGIWSVKGGLQIESGDYSDTPADIGYRYESMNPSVGMRYRVDPLKMDITSALSYVRAEFSDDSDDFGNWEGSVRIQRQWNRYLGMSVGYAHTFMNYLTGESTNYRIHSPTVGAQLNLVDGFPLSINLGYFRKDQDGTDDESGWVVDGNLGPAWQFARGSVRLNASSGYDQSYFGAEQLGFTTYYELEGRAAYAINRYITADVSGTYRRDRYLEEEPVRKDREKRIGGGLSAMPARWISIRAEYVYRALDSTDPGDTYDENRVLVRATLTPRLPVRISP